MGVLQTTITKLKARIDAGVTAEDLTGFSVVNTHHCVADLTPVTVSLDVEDFSETGVGYVGGLGALEEYEVTVSIRIHTGYMGDPCIGSTNAGFVDDISEYLLTYIDLGDNYRIQDISSGELRSTFDDSKTVGAQFSVTVRVPLTFAQA